MKKKASILVIVNVVAFAAPIEEGKMALKYYDYIKAAEAFERSCVEGNAQGCFELGQLYENGQGIAQNKYRASTLYAQACRGGEPLGCSHMGLSSDAP